jgi:hypothetical protein
VGWIGRVQLFIKLPPVIAVDKQTQGTFQRIAATRKASRRSCQTSQVVPQFSVVAFYRVSIGFAFRDFIPAPVIPKTVIGIECIAVILLGLVRIVYHLLNSWLSALPDDFPAQITARFSVYDRDDVDPVFLLPINVNNSSISAVLTSLGTGTSGKLAALALTHNDTVRWWIPRWRPIRRKFIPSTYSCKACLRTSLP